jgi:HEAT repeat protein
MNANRVTLCAVLGLLLAGPLLVGQEQEPSAKLEPLWEDLAGRDAARAYRAVWSLTAAGDRAVVFLKERLRPDAGDAPRIRRLIAELDSRRFAVREAASRNLGRLGVAAEPALREALRGSPSPEVQRRVAALLAQMTDVRPLAGSPEELRTVRAVQALEYIGTETAKGVLRALAGGVQGTRATEDAQAALQRLSR